MFLFLLTIQGKNLNCWWFSTYCRYPGLTWRQEMPMGASRIMSTMRLRYIFVPPGCPLILSFWLSRNSLPCLC